MRPKATLSQTRIWGHRVYFWKTIAVGRLLGDSATISAVDGQVTAIQGLKTAIIRRVVDFPQPEGPRMHTSSPTAP